MTTKTTTIQSILRRSLALLILLFLAQPLLAYYCPATGRFLSRDPIGERGGANVYAFVRNDPAINIDPHGFSTSNARERPQIKSRTKTPVILGECGSFSWTIMFEASPDSNIKTGGVIQQNVQIFYSINSCNGNEITPHPYASGYSYYELWFVHPNSDQLLTDGEITSSPGNTVEEVDRFSHQSHDGTCGTYTVIGFANYYPNPGKPWSQTTRELGILDTPASGTLSSGFFRAKPLGEESNTYVRSITVQWNCCQDSPDRKTHILSKEE